MLGSQFYRDNKWLYRSWSARRDLRRKR